MAKKKYGAKCATKKVLSAKDLAGTLADYVGGELVKRGVGKKWVALIVAVAVAVAGFFFSGCSGGGSFVIEGADGGRVIIQSGGCK